MNLVYKYPKIFWDCACLISDAGGKELFADDDETPEIIDEAIENLDEEEDDNDEETPTKKKQKTTTYGKIAATIGKMKMAGITVSTPDINKSSYTFSPDVENNIIRYGMSGITKVGDDVVKQILTNRPYSSIEDFLQKVKLNKTQMINLIKAGAFDSIYEKSRELIMVDYIRSISGSKTTLNMRNFGKLIEYDLLPAELDFSRRVFNYNKYLKELKKGDNFKLDNIAFDFFEKNFDIDVLGPSESESGFELNEKKWKKIYDTQMNVPKNYIKDNQKELLDKFNKVLFDEIWNENCAGNVSKWEMDSISYYSHNHELATVRQHVYDCENFFALNEEPDTDRIVLIKGKQIPLFKIHRIMGTVLDRDKTKKTITLLTREGVVSVKIFGDVFSHYDRRISNIGADGKKHVIEESWFKRGTKLIITGIRRGEQFFAKKYKSTPYHLCELITGIDDEGYLKIQKERYGEE